MKTLLLLAFIVSPLYLPAAAKMHRIRMVLNVVHNGDRMINIQDAKIDKKVFYMLVKEDGNLTFLEDIGFKYINSITVDIDNNTKEANQTITVNTAGQRIIVRRVPFFKTTYPQNIKYVLSPSLFKMQKYDNELYYLASRSY